MESISIFQRTKDMPLLAIYRDLPVDITFVIKGKLVTVASNKPQRAPARVEGAKSIPVICITVPEQPMHKSLAVATLHALEVPQLTKLSLELMVWLIDAQIRHLGTREIIFYKSERLRNQRPKTSLNRVSVNDGMVI